MAGAWYELGVEGGLAFQPLGAIDDDGGRLWALDWLCGVLAHEVRAVRSAIPLGKKNSGEDAGFAQQPLEALMRRCLPAGERPALIGVDARRFDANQKLPGPGATAELCDRLGRAQGRVVLGQADVKLLRQCRAAGTAGDMPDVPAEHLGE